MLKDPSSLLEKRPLETLRPTQSWEPEALLWWAVVREASRDLRYGHRSLALDALEFLRDTGVWLLTSVFGYDELDAMNEIVGLMLRRNRFHREPLGDSAENLRRGHSHQSGQRGRYSSRPAH